MLTTGQESVAEQVIADLEWQLNSAWATVASSSRFHNAEIRATVLGALATDRARIDRLKGELLDQVAAGTLSFERWAGIATTTRDDIAYQAGLTDEWSLTGILAAAVSETSSDVVEGTKEAVASVGGGAGVGVILGLVLVLWVFK